MFTTTTITLGQHLKLIIGAEGLTRGRNLTIKQSGPDGHELLTHVKLSWRDQRQVVRALTTDTRLVLMTINRQRHWLDLQAAGVAYDNGHVQVEIGGRVIEDGIEREITLEERRAIADIADEYSGMK